MAMALVTLEEAKLWLRVDGDDEDSIIANLLDEAEEKLRDAVGEAWEWVREKQQARTFILAYVADRYEHRGLTVGKGERTMNPVLASLLFELQHSGPPSEGGDEGDG